MNAAAAILTLVSALAFAAIVAAFVVALLTRPKPNRGRGGRI